jgi:hypothetical protein
MCSDPMSVHDSKDVQGGLCDSAFIACLQHEPLNLASKATVLCSFLGGVVICVRCNKLSASRIRIGDHESSETILYASCRRCRESLHWMVCGSATSVAEARRRVPRQVDQDNDDLVIHGDAF